MNRRVLALGLLLMGCSSGKKAAPTTQRDSAAAALPPGTLPEMPPYPVASRGRMVVKSAGAGVEVIEKDWAAEAGVCDNPPMAQIVAQDVGVGGTLVLLALPTNRVTSYPVTTVNQGLPKPPAGQVGVQYYGKTGAYQYQASEGSVDIYAFDKTVSGRFAVTLRELNRNDRVRFVGSFKEVPVIAMDASRCAPAAGGVSPSR